MKRFDCLKILSAAVGDALVVSSAGAMTLEWNALRPSDGNLRVRTLGLCSSIALGMALGLPHRRIIALDGDGSLLMNLCSLPTIARMHPKNLVHIVFDNEIYEASGSKMTATGCGTDLVGIAAAAGIRNARWAKSLDEFSQAVAAALTGGDLHFIGAKVTAERTEVPPYPVDEVENKYRFIRHVEMTEKIEILRTNLPASYS
ncbi:MAG TPA: thiamine pyrophosphate-dependent enzyme [Candidatus Binatia bacterium]|jgi:thiamine pyrophosphate-dependent acetolactate synthase large subunit-like protein